MKESMEYYIEFDTLVQIKFKAYATDWSMQEYGSLLPAKAMISDIRRVYGFLRGLHYDKLVKEIQDSILLDCRRAELLLYFCRELVVRPLTRTLEDSYTMGKNLFKDRKQFAESRNLAVSISSKPEFPCEIGKFLFRRLVHSAPDLDSCKQLTYLYEDENVYKVGKALNDAIVANKPNVLQEESAEFSQILENIWKDKSLQNRVSGIKAGIPVLFAAVGAVSQGLSGAATGLLAGLGLEVADKFLGLKVEAISEKVAKFLSPSYGAFIYDFKRKYPWTISDRKL